MVDLKTPTPEQMASWDAFLATLGPELRAEAAKHPAWKLYRMKSTGHRVLIYSYYDDLTCSVLVLGKYNYIAMERRVFGVAFDDLEECDLPGPDEKVGVFLDPAEQLQHINMLRAHHGKPPLDKLPEDQEEGTCAMEDDHDA